MSKLRCPCSNVMSDVAWPSRHVFYLVGQDDVDGSYEHIPSLDIIGRPEVWVCAKCGRLAVEIGPRNDIRWFSPDPPAQQDALDWLRSHEPVPDD